MLRCACLAGTHDEGLLYLDNRLRSRQTLIEWDKDILGPKEMSAKPVQEETTPTRHKVP